MMHRAPSVPRCASSILCLLVFALATALTVRDLGAIFPCTLASTMLEESGGNLFGTHLLLAGAPAALLAGRGAHARQRQVHPVRRGELLPGARQRHVRLLPSERGLPPGRPRARRGPRGRLLALQPI